jgi:hypothetical protein
VAGADVPALLTVLAQPCYGVMNVLQAGKVQKGALGMVHTRMGGRTVYGASRPRQALPQPPHHSEIIFTLH